MQQSQDGILQKLGSLYARRRVNDSKRNRIILYSTADPMFAGEMSNTLADGVDVVGLYVPTRWTMLY